MDLWFQNISGEGKESGNFQTQGFLCKFTGMPSVLRCQSYALSPPKSSSYSGDKEPDTDQTSPGVCTACYLPIFPALLVTMPLLCPALTTHTCFQPLMILAVSWPRAFACTSYTLHPKFSSLPPYLTCWISTHRLCIKLKCPLRKGVSGPLIYIRFPCRALFLSFRVFISVYKYKFTSKIFKLILVSPKSTQVRCTAQEFYLFLLIIISININN